MPGRGPGPVSGPAPDDVRFCNLRHLVLLIANKERLDLPSPYSLGAGGSRGPGARGRSPETGAKGSAGGLRPVPLPHSAATPIGSRVVVSFEKFSPGNAAMVETPFLESNCELGTAYQYAPAEARVGRRGLGPRPRGTERPGAEARGPRARGPRGPRSSA